jgi:hypothetical protein
VLEVADNSYTTRFGGENVTRSDVLHVQENPRATVVANLESDNIPASIFDCIIPTLLLATFPGISQINRFDMQRWGDYWRFTSLSARRLFEENFPAADVTIETHGNVLAACAFLQGVTAGELRKEELDHHDPDYELLITLRAFKS